MGQDGETGRKGHKDCIRVERKGLAGESVWIPSFCWKTGKKTAGFEFGWVERWIVARPHGPERIAEMEKSLVLVFLQFRFTEMMGGIERRQASWRGGKSVYAGYWDLPAKASRCKFFG